MNYSDAAHDPRQDPRRYTPTGRLRAKVKRAQERYGDECWRSVTEVTEWMPKPFLLAWAAKLAREGKDHNKEGKTARDIGSCVHQLCEWHIVRGEPQDHALAESAAYWGVSEHSAIIAGCYAAFAGWWGKQRADVLHVEPLMFSESMDVGGACDLVFRDNANQIVLADIKTSKQMSDDYVVQLAAYGRMLQECFGLTVDKHIVVRLCKETGTCNVHHVPGPAAEAGLATFLALCAAHSNATALYWEDEDG